MKFFLFLWLASKINALAPLLMPWPATLSINEHVEFDWTSITPASSLIYHECYNWGEPGVSLRYSCARLLVPVDWHTPEEDQISLAVIKLHGNASSSESRDPIFFNPGGPGGSGVQALLSAGGMLQDITSNDGKFDLISFDPRGVGYSTNVHCYDSYINEEIYLVVNWVSADIDAGMSAVKDKLGRIQGRMGTCKDSKRVNVTELRQHLSTGHTARDMLHIHKLESKASQVQDAGSQLSLNNDATKQQAKLNYIGTSYGTMLGVTFASMFPQHTGKMVLDGNIDGDAWISKWPLDFVNDFESIWDVFSKSCLAAKERCKLWRPSDRSAKDIMKRVKAAFEHIKDNPISVHDTTGSGVFTYANLRFTASVLFYHSTALELVAVILNDVLENRFTVPMLGNGPTLGLCSPLDDETRFNQEPLTVDAWLATMCGDADPNLNEASLKDFQRYVKKMHKQSPTSGARLAEWRLYCMAWQQQFTARGRFSGPFGDSQNAIKTPILFLNNRYDPVTPIMNARSMSKKFPGSIVLEQDAVGHCALFSATGQCIKEHVRRYFQDGTLPVANTVCQGACKPFEDCSVESNWRSQQIFKGLKLWQFAR